MGHWMLGLYLTGYVFGFRSEEVVELLVGQIDMVNGCVRLDDSKNGDSRLAYMTLELQDALVPLVAQKRPTDRVFTREDDSVICDFRKAWWTVCVAAGLGELRCRKCGALCDNLNRCLMCSSHNVGYKGLLFHDLRRTAVRNMVRRGVPEKWAMAISGHKTRSVFDRYNIVSESDLKDAALRMHKGAVRERESLSEWAAKISTGAKEHSLGTVLNKPLNLGAANASNGDS